VSGAVLGLPCHGEIAAISARQVVVADLLGPQAAVMNDVATAFHGALALDSQHLDGRKPPSGFAHGLLREMGVAAEDLLGWTYGRDTRAGLASVAALVSRLANAGVIEAVGLMQEAAGHLALAGRTAGRLAKLDAPQRWSFAGGVMQDATLMTTLMAALGPPVPPVLPRWVERHWLRQIHPAADDRGSGRNQLGYSFHRGAGCERRRAKAVRHCDGVPELRALSAYVGARQYGFSLHLRGQSKAEISTAVNKAAEILGLSPYLDRTPKQPSGGQRQRVAMGRAIVRRPAVFLFDEPLSNLDAALRVQMRAEIRALHESLGSTSIFVTHDQVEAMTTADRILVMRDGRQEQAGPPLELYDRPANSFVAEFIGSPAMNLLEAVAEGGPMLPIQSHASGAVLCGIRPEHLELTSPDAPGRLRGS
jgi:ABC-type Fe3+/spermidine/putrescine transport system ATPase subunit